MRILQSYYLIVLYCLALMGCGSGNSSSIDVNVSNQSPSTAPTPTLSIADINVDSGGKASLKVSLSKPSSQAVTVAYATKDDSAMEGTDYTAKSGTLTFAAGVTEQTIEVVTLAANSYQPNSRTLTVELSNPANASISDSNAVVTIKPSSLPTPTPTPMPAPILQLAIADISVNEGATASLKVSLSKPSSQAVTVDYTTKDDSAMEGTDYTAKSGTLTFAAGETEQAIEVVTLAANSNQPESKTLTVELSNSANASISDSNAVVTIVPAAAPEAAGLTLSFGKVKTFSFNWQDSPKATYYQLLEDPDGQSGYTQVGEDIEPNIQTVDHIVPLYARVNARYLLKSCNASGCKESDPVHISPRLSDITASIGYFKASNTSADDRFGWSVSLSADGKTLAVVAIWEDSNATGINGEQTNNNASNAGAVYIFTRNATGWSQQAYIKASNTGADDWFGNSVSLSADGNTLAVSADREDSAATGINGGDSAESNNDMDRAGAVYLFTRTATGWSQQAYIKASNTGAYDYFGNSVSLSADGNTLAVAAYKSGAVYVY